MGSFPSLPLLIVVIFFFSDTATTESYTLSLHDALPISVRVAGADVAVALGPHGVPGGVERVRSEEHTSELQSRGHLVCRLLLEKKKEEEYKLTERSMKSERNANVRSAQHRCTHVHRRIQ